MHAVCDAWPLTRCRLLKAATDEYATPAPPPVPTGIEFASSDDEDIPPPPPLFPADFFSPSGSGAEAGDSPDFMQRTPPPPLPLPPLPPPLLDVSALARELQVQGLSEEEQVAIAMEERCPPAECANSLTLLTHPQPAHGPPRLPAAARAVRSQAKPARPGDVWRVSCCGVVVES